MMRGQRYISHLCQGVQYTCPDGADTVSSRKQKSSRFSSQGQSAKRESFSRSRTARILLPRRVRLDGQGSIPRRGKNFMYSTASEPALRPTEPPIQWVRDILPGVKRLGRETHHSPAFSDEVKKCGAISPVPHMCPWPNA
jgi:hypothetical protein